MNIIIFFTIAPAVGLTLLVIGIIINDILDPDREMEEDNDEYCVCGRQIENGKCLVCI